MKTRFHVAPAWWGWVELAGNAAAEYVRLNDANLDYPQRVMIQTLQYNDAGEGVRRQFEVVRVPAFEVMREVKHAEL